MNSNLLSHTLTLILCVLKVIVVYYHFGHILVVLFIISDGKITYHTQRDCMKVIRVRRAESLYYTL